MLSFFNCSFNLLSYSLLDNPLTGRNTPLISYFLARSNIPESCLSDIINDIFASISSPLTASIICCDDVPFAEPMIKN